jgi:predicted dithiol-disulfide oxidoreductase (DUF899 family)
MEQNKPANEIQKIEKEIFELTQKLEKLRKDSVPVEVKNYSFKDLNGEVSLLELFGDKDELLLIHNMGQGCRYCTLWGDGINGLVPHLENACAVALVSKDAPELQRTFANSRQWRFRMVSHGGGDYIREQSVLPGEDNVPGIVCYQRKGNKISKKNFSVFGPGDVFCSQWHLLSLAGIGTEDWTPQYNYWQRPSKMDDGGQNLT